MSDFSGNLVSGGTK